MYLFPPSAQLYAIKGFIIFKKKKKSVRDRKYVKTSYVTFPIKFENIFLLILYVWVYVFDLRGNILHPRPQDIGYDSFVQSLPTYLLNFNV